MPIPTQPEAPPAKRLSVWLPRLRSDLEQFGLSRRVVSRVGWDLERFGLTPQGLVQRVRGSNGSALLSNSLPKAGTHLLERALCMHPSVHRRLVPTLYPANFNQWGGLERLLRTQGPGSLLVGHIQFDQRRLALIERAGVKAFFVVRDPRDIVVSNAFYISASPFHHWHRVVNSQPDLRSKIRLLIEGHDAYPQIPGIGSYLETFAGWLDTSALVVRYEDLAPDGQERLAALRRIYEHAAIEVSEESLFLLADRLVSAASPTFRSGTTEQWREYFDPDLSELFESRAGPFLSRYGYDL